MSSPVSPTFGGSSAPLSNSGCCCAHLTDCLLPLAKCSEPLWAPLPLPKPALGPGT